ncbi:hypothetical protein JTB14_014956 [Gonioctena quinquepunctata]|nr:hypothetical protein JTB14_014956 [Gonioctena quinquepunctata]
MNIEKVFSDKLLSAIKKLEEINAQNLNNLWEKLEKLTEIRSENNNNADNNKVEKSYSTIVKNTTASESTADRNKAKGTVANLQAPSTFRRKVSPYKTTIDVPNIEKNDFKQPRRKRKQGRVGTADVANSIDTGDCFEGSTKSNGRKVWVLMKKVKDDATPEIIGKYLTLNLKAVSNEIAVKKVATKILTIIVI